MLRVQLSNSWARRWWRGTAKHGFFVL